MCGSNRVAPADDGIQHVTVPPKFLISDTLAYLRLTTLLILAIMTSGVIAALITTVRQSQPRPNGLTILLSIFGTFATIITLLRIVFTYVIRRRVSEQCLCTGPFPIEPPPALAAEPAEPSGACGCCDKTAAMSLCEWMYILGAVADPDVAYFALFGGKKRTEVHAAFRRPGTYG
jgi:hypothetical protein